MLGHSVNTKLAQLTEWTHVPITTQPTDESTSPQTSCHAVSRISKVDSIMGQLIQEPDVAKTISFIFHKTVDSANDV